MSKSSLQFSNLKVGLTVFIGLVIFFFFIFLVGTSSDYFSKTYKLKMFVENVNGLADGSLVSLGGMKIGDVSDMTFAQKDGENGILITLNIKAKYQNQITLSSSAKIQTLGLLGDKFVDVSIGQPDEKTLKDGDFIKVEQAFSLETLATKINPALDDFTKAISNIKSISDSISRGKGSIAKLINNSNAADELESILKDLKKFSVAVIDKKGTLGKLAFNDEIFNNLNELSDNLNSISRNLKEGKGSLGQFLNDDSVYVYTKSVANRMDKLLAKTDNDSTVIGGLLNDKNMYKELNSLIIELNNLVTDLKQNPDRYINVSVF